MKSKANSKVITVIILLLLFLALVVCYSYLFKTEITPKESVQAGQNSTPPPPPEKKYPRPSKRVNGLEFAQNFGGKYDDLTREVFLIGNTFYCIGTTASADNDFSSGGKNIFLTKIDLEGNILSCKTFSKPNSLTFLSAEYTPQGVFILSKATEYLIIDYISHDEKIVKTLKIDGGIEGVFHYASTNKLYFFYSTKTSLFGTNLNETLILDQIYHGEAKRVVEIFDGSKQSINVICEDKTATLNLNISPEGAKQTLLCEGQFVQILPFAMDGSQYFGLLTKQADKLYYTLLTSDYTVKNTRAVASGHSGALLPSEDKMIILINGTTTSAYLTCLCGCPFQIGFTGFEVAKTLSPLYFGDYFCAGTAESRLTKSDMIFYQLDGLTISQKTLVGEENDHYVKSFFINEKYYVFSNSDSKTEFFAGNYGAYDSYLLCFTK